MYNGTKLVLYQRRFLLKPSLNRHNLRLESIYRKANVRRPSRETVSSGLLPPSLVIRVREPDVVARARVDGAAAVARWVDAFQVTSDDKVTPPWGFEKTIRRNNMEVTHYDVMLPCNYLK
jgi:hypothetical protein